MRRWLLLCAAASVALTCAVPFPETGFRIVGAEGGATSAGPSSSSTGGHASTGATGGKGSSSSATGGGGNGGAGTAGSTSSAGGSTSSSASSASSASSTGGPLVCDATTTCVVKITLKSTTLTTKLGYTLDVCPQGATMQPPSCIISLDLGETQVPLGSMGAEVDASPTSRQGTVSVQMVSLPVTYVVGPDMIPLVATITSEGTCPPDIATGAGPTDVPCSADLTGGGAGGGSSDVPGCGAGLTATSVTVSVTPGVCCDSMSSTLCSVFSGMYVGDASNAITTYVVGQIQAAIAGAIMNQACLHG